MRMMAEQRAAYAPKVQDLWIDMGEVAVLRWPISKSTVGPWSGFIKIHSVESPVDRKEAKKSDCVLSQTQY